MRGEKPLNHLKMRIISPRTVVLQPTQHLPWGRQICVCLHPPWFGLGSCPHCGCGQEQLTGYKPSCHDMNSAAPFSGTSLQ